LNTTDNIDFASLLPKGLVLDEAHDQRIAEQRAKSAAQEEEQRLKELRTHLAECGCPIKDLLRALSGDLNDTEAYLAAQVALSGRESLTVLSGLPGCGKTTAAAWWLVQKRERVEFISPTEARFIDAGVLVRWPKFDEVRMRQITRARALVIDDLGTEYSDKHGAFLSMLDEVVNSRYSAELPTLITTNLTAPEFKSRYGARIADRIREAGSYVELSDKSLRGGKSK
jgi:DNA replication protein DnaC